MFRSTFSLIFQANYKKVLRITSLRSKLETFVQKIYPRGTNKKTGEISYGKPEKLPVCDALLEIIASTDVRFANDSFVQMVRARLQTYNITPSVFLKFAR